MKIIFFILISIFLSEASCKKNITDNDYWGYVSAQKNGENWSAKIRAGINTHFQNKFDILIDRFSDPETMVESLEFENIPKSVNRYRLFKRDYTTSDSSKSTAADYTLGADGDVICDIYSVDESDSINNYIQIDNFDVNTNEVKGRFSLKLLIFRLPKCNNMAPDTIIFTNGNFYTKVNL